MAHKQRSIFEYVSSKKVVRKDQSAEVSSSAVVKIEQGSPEEVKEGERTQMFCPICDFELTRFTLEARSVHVNRCIDPPSIKQVSPPKKRKKTSKNLKTTQVDDKPRATTKIKEEILVELKEEEKLSEIIDEEINSSQVTQEAKGQKRRRSGRIKPPIPEHKILSFPEAGEENIIAVDAFCYSPNEKISIYLLTHFHSDHYGGLCKSWDNGNMIICTPITSRLMQGKFKIPFDRIFVLEKYGVPTEIPGTEMQVTVFDANHCPGAGIFVIECSGVKYLHCGDFRANNEMIEKLLNRYPSGFDKCYLDTTYLSPTYTFPSQSDVVNCTSEWIKKKCAVHRSKQQRIIDFFKSRTSQSPDIAEFLVVIGTYSIGKEKLALGISKALDTKIFCPKDKYDILKEYEWDELTQRLDTENVMECGVHLLPLRKTRKEFMVDYLKKYSSKYKAILVVIPTGWTFGYGTRTTSSNTSMLPPKTQTEQMVDSFERGFNVGGSRGDLVIVRKIQVPYSEHSSFSELMQFVKRLDVKEWIPTVNMNSVGSQLQLIQQIQEGK